MTKIFKFPVTNIQIAITLIKKARELQDNDSSSEAAADLFIEASRYFLIDARSSRKQIQALKRENKWLNDNSLPKYTD